MPRSTRRSLYIELSATEWFDFQERMATIEDDMDDLYDRLETLQRANDSKSRFTSHDDVLREIEGM